MIRRQFLTGVTVLCFGALLAGCSRSPRVSFYTLGVTAKSGVINPATASPPVSVVNLTLPDLVDRPQLVERVSVNRVEMLETQRWAEPLKKGISRLLTENLANQLGSDLVTACPQNASSEADYKVSVDIQRFESMGDTVSVDATWSVRRTSTALSEPDEQDKILFAKTGRSQVRESRKGEGYDALVTAYSQAIASLSNDIAQAIRSNWERKGQTR